jgi:hypothetical protein
MRWREVWRLLDFINLTDRTPWGFSFIQPRLVVTKKRLLLVASLPLITVAVILGGAYSPKGAIGSTCG